MASDAGARRETTSDASGRYAFPLLQPGVYRLQVSMSGFGSTTVQGVVAKITEITDLDVTLKIASQEQVVEVSAEGSLVQTESATRGEVIQSGTLRQLPLQAQAAHKC